MKVRSKIKTMFSEDLLRYIAAICDTKRIESNNRKMIVLGDLLYSNGIQFEILGGATNRIALQIDGYAVKFALDEQGYQDNLIEYALSPELQPFVTKSYETNGYVQVQECVDLMDKELFGVHKVNIYKILDTMAQDYLLGDVGYIDKNRTNWGLRDGKPVILDYAYCHRATENLFTCEKCGSALTPDAVYDKYLCSDRSGCKASYTYNDRKAIQGNQVDIDMIKERKADSIKLEKGENWKEIETFENRLVGNNYILIDCPADNVRYKKLKEEAEMKLSINGNEGDDMATLEERFNAMVDLAKNPDDLEAREILFSGNDEDTDVPEPIYTDRYQELYMGGNTIGIPLYNLPVEENDEDGEDDEDVDYSELFSQMVDTIKETNETAKVALEERISNQEREYLESLKQREEVKTPEPDPEPEEVAEEPVTESRVIEPEEVIEEPPIIDLSGAEVLIPEPEPVEPPTSAEIEEATILLNGKPLSSGDEKKIKIDGEGNHITWHN
jgi:hypothetical protein